MKIYVILAALFFSFEGATGLDCFSCISLNTNRQCMQRDPVTCGWGEICHNTVERGGFSGIQYTKGCMSASHCYGLQNLNSGKSCDLDPSICVFCCEGELCNMATSLLPVPGFAVVTSLLTLMTQF